MFNIKSELHKALSLLKGFESGYTSLPKHENIMLIEHNGKVYRIELEKVGNGSIYDYSHLLK